jgi:hypothetical protein
MTDGCKNLSSWDSYLEEPEGYDASAPLVRTSISDRDFVADMLADCHLNAPTLIPPPVLELEDRSIEISNFDPSNLTEETILAESQKHGAVEAIDTSDRQSGRIVVQFYDIRSALSMRYSNVCFAGRTWHLRFAHPKAIADLQQPRDGIVVLDNVPPDITDEMIAGAMMAFGEIREIRSSGEDKVIEFWDVRSARRALERIRTMELFVEFPSALDQRPLFAR